MRSMTGYGDAVSETPEFVLGIDIKAVNNRFLKISSKISDEVSFLQVDLDEAVRKRLARGSIFFTLRFQPTTFSDLYQVNEDVVKKYVDTVKKLREELGSTEDVRLQDILTLPGAIKADDSVIPERAEVLPIALETMENALAKMIEMREHEGGNLREELRVRYENVGSLMGEVKKAAPQALEEHFRKLEERTRALLGEQKAGLDEGGVLREAALLAERSDIREEIARMDSHLEQFSETMESTEPVGRKLEFICQEMFRESNTMGSKAPGSEVGRSVVEIKAEVDRLKEQVLNVE